MGNPNKKVEPLDTRNILWGAAEQVVKAGVEHRKKNAVVLTVAQDGVKDGDTIKFKNGAANGILNGVCRVDGIDARETGKSWKKNPEPGQAYGEEAAAVLQKMIENKELRVTVTQAVDGTKSRSVCQIDIEGGENLSAGLVKAGAAFLTERFFKTKETPLQTGEREALRVFQKEAIASEKGMYGDKNPRKLDTSSPDAYRRKMKLLNPD